MNYLAKVSGTVHSVDPIFNELGYARAVFGNRIHHVRTRAEGRKLHFQVVGMVKVNDNSTLGDFTQGLITGDDTNVQWEIQLMSARVRSTSLVAA